MKTISFLLAMVLFSTSCGSDSNKGALDYDPRYAAGLWKESDGLVGAHKAMASVCVELFCRVEAPGRGALVLVTEDARLELYVDELERKRFSYRISENSNSDEVFNQTKKIFSLLQERGVEFEFDARGPPY